MIRKLLLVFGFTSLVSLLAFLGYGIINKLAAKKEASIKIQAIPIVNLYTIDSVIFQFPTSSSIVLIYFDSGCEHCQYQLRELNKNLDSFSNTQLVLMSSENISNIKKVAESFDFIELPNIYFTKINAKDVFDAFGSISVPRIFVYGEDRKLIKEFKGETRMDTIIKSLP